MYIDPYHRIPYSYAVSTTFLANYVLSVQCIFMYAYRSSCVSEVTPACQMPFRVNGRSKSKAVLTQRISLSLSLSQNINRYINCK